MPALPYIGIVSSNTGTGFNKVNTMYDYIETDNYICPLTSDEIQVRDVLEDCGFTEGMIEQTLQDMRDGSATLASILGG